MSNMAGRLADWDTARPEVWDGTNQVGKKLFIGSELVSELGGSGVSGRAVDMLSRASTKKSSVAPPLFLTSTGMVTGVPAASLTLGLSGSPVAVARVWLTMMLPVN